MAGDSDAYVDALFASSFYILELHNSFFGATLVAAPTRPICQFATVPE